MSIAKVISKHIHHNEEFKAWILNSSNNNILNLLEKCYESQAIVEDINKKSMASSNKGIIGEQLVFDILERYYHIKSTAKYSKAGDFQIKTDVGNILIEVKNYSKTVGKIELDKFERDIARDNKIRGAIFISLNSRIVGYKESVHFEEELIDGRTMPIVYLSSKDSRIIKVMIDLIIAHMRSKVRTSDIDIDFVISKVEELSKQMRLLSQCRTQITEMRTSLNKYIDDIYKNVAILELNLSKTVGEIQAKIKWKREIPISSLNELYKFLNDKFELFGYARPVVLMIKKIISEMYYQDIKWYYTDKYVSSNDIKIHISTNKIHFKKKYITRSIIKELSKRDDITINKNVIVPIKKETYNVIIQMIYYM